MPSFTPEQTIFSLAMLAGLADAYTGSVATIEPALTTDLNNHLTAMTTEIGSWEVVWGPAVYELPTSNRPDNTMYVARGNGQPGFPNLVVAIAGTNPYSLFDWLVEDLLVTPQIPWPSGKPFSLERRIALGTFIGLSALQTLKPGAAQPGAGTTLKEFLATQVSAPLSLAITGHSLGGALSPTVALWLHDVQKEWDPAGHASLSVLPAAGPTAGNQAFANYSDAQIGAEVTRLHNPLDIVPHAWTTSDLQQLPTLYAPAIPTSDLLNDLVDLAIDISKFGDYTQINLNAPPLPGSAVNTSQINPNASPFVNFLSQAVYQHIEAYFDLLGIPKDTPPLSDLLLRLKASAGVVDPAQLGSRLQSKLAKFRA
jgi:triacylglycerol lipase